MLMWTPYKRGVTHVFFYGAGSSSAALCTVIEEGLQRVFNQAKVTVDHDLVGAAYSTYDGRPGITCIIGTGSNSCHFNGSNVSEEVPALAYILGDEASGSWHGKKLLAAKLYHHLPAEIEADFDATYGLSKNDIIDQCLPQRGPQCVLGEFHDLHWKAQGGAPCSKLGFPKVLGHFLTFTSSVSQGGRVNLCTSSEAWLTTSKRSSGPNAPRMASRWGRSSRSPSMAWQLIT